MTLTYLITNDSGMSFAGTAESVIQCVGEITNALCVLEPYTMFQRMGRARESTAFWHSRNGKGTIENATTVLRGLAVADPILIGLAGQRAASTSTSSDFRDIFSLEGWDKVAFITISTSQHV